MYIMYIPGYYENSRIISPLWMTLKTKSGKAASSISTAGFCVSTV